MTEQNTASLLWLGAGEIAKRCVKRFDEYTFETTLVSRSMSAPSENLLGVTRLQASLSEPDEALKLAKLRPHFCVCTFSPKGRAESDYRHSYLDSLTNILRAFDQIQHRPHLFIFVSSTSVYGQCAAERVDEESQTSSGSVSSSTMLACEALLAKQPFPSCALRFSGIYGPGRYHLLNQVLKGFVGADHWTNRIHVEDCAGIIAFLIMRSLNKQDVPATLLASDDSPIVSKALYQWLRRQMCMTEMPSGGQAQLDVIKSAAPSSRGLGKRCDNRLLKSLGYRLRYPSYEAGFPDIIQAFDASRVAKGR